MNKLLKYEKKKKGKISEMKGLEPLNKYIKVIVTRHHSMLTAVCAHCAYVSVSKHTVGRCLSHQHHPLYFIPLEFSIVHKMQGISIINETILLQIFRLTLFTFVIISCLKRTNKVDNQQ